MADFYKQKNLEMQNVTQKYVLELVKIWRRIFDKDECMENLEKLVEHASNFYEDLITESKNKEEFVRNEIIELKKESENLKRLLNVDIVIDINEDAPLFVVLNHMDESLADLRETLRLRKEQIYELLLEQESLCEELAENPRPLVADPLPTDDEIQEFKQYLEKLKEERDERFSKVTKMRREIKSHLNTLELEITNEIEDRLLNQRDIKLTKETLQNLNRMLKSYSNQVYEVREKIEEMKSKLKTLWDRLDTSPKTRNKYMRYTQYTQSSYDVFNAELNRCEALKRQNIQMFVTEIRKEIAHWWDKTLKSEVQRNRFSNYNNSCYTDDLLVLHEMELEDLKLFYESNKKIFELYQKRKLLWERMLALEAKASDTARYNNRGGQLLKEEKERKMIATKLPKIEEQITELVRQFEDRDQKEFLVYGENILDVMAREWEQKRQAKEQQSSARKQQQQTPHSKSMLTASRTPLFARSASSASVRKAAAAIISNRTAASATTGAKRKLNTNDAPALTAKRSLIHAINSPSVFLKPTNSVVRTPFKSPLLKTRLMAGALRRRSGHRNSGSGKKRRSVHKANTLKPPLLTVTDCSKQQQHEETYDAFQKSIEPEARSSIMPNSTISSKSTNRMLMTDDDDDCENIHPRTLHQRTLKTPPRTPHSPGASTSRKLTTKNLPILI